MSSKKIKRLIDVAARNIAVALTNHDEIHIATYNRDSSGRLVDRMDVVERIVREQLEGTITVGPGYTDDNMPEEGGEDQLEQDRRTR